MHTTTLSKKISYIYIFSLLVEDRTTGLSEYELMIQRNIAEKRKFLDSLGIYKMKEELDASHPSHSVKKPTYRGITKRSADPQPYV